MATESLLQRIVRWRLEDLLIKYPGLRPTSAAGGSVKVAGVLAFVAEAPGRETVGDEYIVEFLVPDNFPNRVPPVWETGGRIPSSFHKLEDGSLCLGTPTRVRLILAESPSILQFVELCVIPYLYGYSYFERHGILPFGELKHGREGIREDLAALFGADREDAACEFVALAAMRKRSANRQPCPCGSQRRLGQCHHRRVNTLRSRLGRQWFRGGASL